MGNPENLPLPNSKEIIRGKNDEGYTSYAQERVPSQFQRKVYRALKRIPQGKVISYKSLARRIGMRSARAVGSALAKNPFPLIIPCHRVVSSDRKIGGFWLGRNLKKRLLEMEGVTLDKKGKIPEKFFV